jgi:hypothetical protein
MGQLDSRQLVQPLPMCSLIPFQSPCANSTSRIATQYRGVAWKSACCESSFQGGVEWVGEEESSEDSFSKHSFL